MGNPQNLFIFSYYKLNAAQFFTPIFLFALSGLVWLYMLNYSNHNVELKISLDAVELKSTTETIIWAGLFSIIVLSVFNIVSYKLALAITLAVTLTLKRKLLYEVDYLLLITFVCFFIFIGNVSTLPGIYNYMKNTLDNGVSTYFSSIILSQFISNVPCSILLSRFTPHWKELLLGVNIGGMGTLIASLASVISYKFYVKEHPQSSRKYLYKFTVYNILSLLLFTLINYFVIV
jgi:Na+/H+ antiporter NhaD/arsenite permease-like protein